MTHQLVHRGPDDGGLWVSPKHPLALGNRRLKVVDLSNLGHQPMRTLNGRWVLTYNGEIYNYLELRDELSREGFAFRSRTDTEVLLAALTTWGPQAIHKINGVFAFALWDEVKGRLLLARDRLGVKPLYYATVRDQMSFGSEISAVLASGLIEPSIDRESLESFLRLLWVPEPGTLFSGVFKLLPGHMLTWDGSRVEVSPYWDVPKIDLSKLEGPPSDNEELAEVLRSAVRRQLKADVPVGLFLSGGLDSTAILHFAAEAGNPSLRAYSVGLSPTSRAEEGALDDVKYARLAAQTYGIPHHEIVLSPNVAELLPKMVRHLEDPVADPAAINCYLVSEAARETSTVLLSGTGADELFGGYRKYAAAWLGSQYQRIPAILRRCTLEPLFRSLPVALGNVGLRHVRMSKKFMKFGGAADFDRFLGYSGYYDSGELIELLMLDPSRNGDAYLGAHALQSAWDRRASADVIDRMTYVDLKYYLPGLGLAYMDKASMSASVEVRVPLIDDAVVDFVARLPGRYKVQGLRTKVALRDCMQGRIPDEILRRPKAPFSAPIRSWLRRDLASTLDEYLHPEQIRTRGLLDAGAVSRIILEHRQGWQDHSLRIWALLTLEVWYQEFIDTRVRFSMPRDYSVKEMMTVELGT